MIDAIPSLISNMGLGLSTALMPHNLMFCFIGVFLGTLLGVLPGVGGLTAIAMLLPMTFYMEPTTALIMMAGIFYGSSYGGSIASILINVPGTPMSAVVCIDGHPMAMQGRAGPALLMTALASFLGGSIGIVLMMLFSPVIAAVGLQFGPTEYFALMLLGLIAASTITGDNPLKGMAMVVLGLLFSMVGMDVYTGVPRFTFGSPSLYEGVGLIPLAMGIYGIGEMIATARKKLNYDIKKVTLRSLVPTRDDVQRFWPSALRGTAIGAFFGILPGVGSTVATFTSYAVERRVAKDPSRFGKGAIEGIIAPEASNNASDQTAFIPTLTLGIPGSVTMALLLGVLMIHGITPGPTMIINQPEIFWGLVMSFWVGNVLLLILNIPLIGVWVRLLSIPFHYLYPAILMFVCIGVYSVNNNIADVWVAIAFGGFGYVMSMLGFAFAPLLLGFVLGSLLEEHFRRALILSNGDFITFVDRPISGTVLAICAFLIVWSGVGFVRRRRMLASEKYASVGAVDLDAKNNA